MSVDAAHPRALRAAALAQPGAVERSSGLVKFRCPGCFDEGHDTHQDNACLFDDGRWGCAVDPAHREAIGRTLGAFGARDNGGPAAPAREVTGADAPSRRAEAVPPEPVGWPLYDGSERWDFPVVAELIESILPASGVVWLGGLPKRYKSLFALYLSLAIACRRSSVTRKFLVRAFPKILYVAREDSGARLQDRRDDILSAWKERPQPGAIVFCIRPRLDLLDPAHVAWLRETCLRLGITMLVLDTWTALSPAADPLGAKDQAALAAAVVKLCEDIGGKDTVTRHCQTLVQDGLAEKLGSGKATRFVAVTSAPPHPPSAEDEKGMA